MLPNKRISEENMAENPDIPCPSTLNIGRKSKITIVDKMTTCNILYFIAYSFVSST